MLFMHKRHLPTDFSPTRHHVNAVKDLTALHVPLEDRIPHLKAPQQAEEHNTFLVCHVSLAWALATAESSTSHLYTLDFVTITGILFLLRSGHETMPSVQRMQTEGAD